MISPMIRPLCLLACLGLLLVPATQAAETTSTTATTNGKPAILNGLPEGVYALFNTNHGEFVAQLFVDKVPKTTANFIGLAEGTKEYVDPRTGTRSKAPFYNGTIFHRIIDGFMIQGGDRTGTGRGGPGYEFADEFVPELKHTKAGILSMANAGPNTNGSQFFITVAPTPHLDNRHSIFGEIVKGMSQVMEIAKVPTAAQDRPVQDVRLETVKIYRLDASGNVKPAANGATAANNATTTATK